MINVIYASAATQKMYAHELAKLLQDARKNNEALDISGMLLFHNGSFLQILEGEEDAVETLVAKIKQDPRHKSFNLLLREEIEERDFEDWSMGYVDVSGLADQIQGFVDYKSQFQAALNDTSKARRIVKAFQEGIWRQHVEN